MNKLKIIPMEWEWLKAGKHCFVFSVVLPNYAENINTLIKHLFYARHYAKYLHSLTYLKFRAVPFYRIWGLRGSMVTRGDIQDLKPSLLVPKSGVLSTTLQQPLNYFSVTWVLELIRTNLQKITLRRQFTTERKAIERCKVERVQTVFSYLSMPINCSHFILKITLK